MVSPHDALERFFRSTASLLALLEPVTSRERWQARPRDEPWSIGETVEHIVLTNRTTLVRLRTGPTAALAAGSPRFPDERITERMFDGLPAPPGIAEPAGRFATREEGVAALVAVRDGLGECVRDAAPRLRDLALPHPVFGPLDGVQWVLFLAAHTDNHQPQLRRLAAPR